MGDPALWYPARPKPFEWCLPNLYGVITSAKGPTNPIFVTFHPVGFSRHNIPNIYDHFGFFLSFFLFFGGFLNRGTAHTGYRIFTRNTPKDSVCPKEVPFGGQKSEFQHLPLKIPQKPKFWGLDLEILSRKSAFAPG